MTVDTELLTSTQMADAAGVSYRQLDYWARIGLVEPLVAGRGSGARRGWHPNQTAKIRALGTLSALSNTAGKPSVIMQQVAASSRRTGPWIFQHDGVRIIIEITS